jgi:hypothetical protein
VTGTEGLRGPLSLFSIRRPSAGSGCATGASEAESAGTSPLAQAWIDRIALLPMAKDVAEAIAEANRYAWDLGDAVEA